MDNEQKKATPGKIALAVAAVVVLVAVLIALVTTGLGGSETAEVTEPAAVAETTEATVPADGNPDDETAKGTYTASDEEVIAAADVVVARMGEYELTNGQFQIFYWQEVSNFLNQYGSIAYYYGLDYTKPLDTQLYSEGVTWQQVFVASALNTWRLYQSLAVDAQAADFQLEAEMQDMLDNAAYLLEQDAFAMGYGTADVYLAKNMGNAATIDAFVHFLDVQYHGLGYLETLLAENAPTEAEMEAYFTENEASYLENGVAREDKYVDVRHVLIMPEGADSSTIRTETFDEAAWETSRIKAEELLAQWETGDKSEDSFAALAMENSQDGSASTGGLYTDVVKGQMVEAFENWCFDESRKTGDYGIVETEFGYHLMFFVDSRPVWKDAVETEMIQLLQEELINASMDKYTMEAEFGSILIANVDLGGEAEEIAGSTTEVTETAVEAESLLSAENMPVLAVAGVSIVALAAVAFVFNKKEH